jgi:nitrate/nitrite-specific signal transduction histidine kinase
VEVIPFAPVPLEAALHWATMNLQTVIKSTRASVTHPLPTVMADHVQLVQLLQNPVGIAIKYRKKEELPEIHVSAQEREQDWVISVCDNGIGIPSQYSEAYSAYSNGCMGTRLPALASGWRSASGSSKNTAGVSGSNQNRGRAPSSISHCGKRVSGI